MLLSRTVHTLKGGRLAALVAAGLIVACSAVTAADLEKQGLELAGQGRWQEAVAKYDRAIEKDPELGTAYLNRASAYVALGLPEDALADFETASRLDVVFDEAATADRATAYIGHAEMEIEARNYARSLEDAQAALRYAPERKDELLSLMARSYQEKGRSMGVRDLSALPDFARAVELLDEALTVTTDLHEVLGQQRASVLHDMAEVHYQSGVRLRAKYEYQAAIDAFSMAIELDPAYALAYRDRGFAYWGLYGSTPLQPSLQRPAAEDMGRAVDLGLNDAYFTYLAGNWYWGARDYQRAIYYLTLAIDAITSDKPYTNVPGSDTLSMAYEFRGRSYAVLDDCPRFSLDWKAAIESTSSAFRKQVLGEQGSVGVARCRL